jgi:hypothetical protein
MEKQVLGRNLEALLGNRAKRRQKGDPFASEPDPVSPGVRSLMNGQQTAPDTRNSETRNSFVPTWYLFAADILLAGVALLVFCKSPHPLSWQRTLFCAGAVILGACLALAAVLPANE